MITREPSFVTGDKQSFTDLDAAIGHELLILLSGGNVQAAHTEPVIQDAFIQVILANREKVIELLSTPV